MKRFMSRAMPCYECTNCKNKDCMNCRWCHDKKKYGGPGRLNKRCITRCTNPKLVEMTEQTARSKMVRMEDGVQSYFLQEYFLRSHLKIFL